MIEDPKTAPGDPPDPNERPDKDDALDEAIANSMDASDPPAIVSKGQPTAPPRRPKGTAASEGGPKPGEADRRRSGKNDHQ